MKAIVIGAGEVGYSIADILSREGNDIILVDKDETRLKSISENLDVQTILGSGSSPRILKKAKIDQAEMIVAVTDSDETNIVACLIASAKSKVPIKIARIRTPDLDQETALFGKDYLNINLCINPEREAVKKAISLMEYAGASEVMDFADGRIKLIAFSIDRSCAMVGKNLEEFSSLYSGEALIASIVRNNELVVPTGSTVLLARDYIFTFVETSHVTDFLRFFGKDTERAERVFIMGGSNTAMLLAEELELKGISTKIIEKRQAQCELLSGRLNKTICLQGDGTSQDLLREENIQGVDYFVAVTGDEEANILGALLAKQLGAKRALCLINKVDYTHLVPMIGIDGVMNPRRATIGKILHYIRKGKIISSIPLGDEKAEAVEFIALETSEITGRPLKKIKFPKGTIIGSILRNDRVIIPTGNTVIVPGDHVILVTLRSAIPQIEKILTVKLDYFG
ncbi:MAG: Trk system potassium transporter TrkA [Syntrophales bacterium]|nr:Trk system potassium transporter TrkA [Syntrophales bacterium]